MFLDSDDLFYEKKISFFKTNISYKFDLYCNAEKIVNLDNGTSKVWKYGPAERNFYEIMLKYGNKFSVDIVLIVMIHIDIIIKLCSFVYLIFSLLKDI